MSFYKPVTQGITETPRPLRVLLVSAVGEHGGAEQVLLSLIKHLPSHNVTPILACLRPGPLAAMARKQGAVAYEFRDHRMREWNRVAQGIGWLKTLIRRERVDIVHSNLTAHLYGSIAARMTRTPELWHIYDYPHERDSITRIQEKLPTNFILFATRYAQSGYPRLSARACAIVPPVCTEPGELRAWPPQPDIRARYGLGTGPLFLTVARFQEHKGHAYLLQAIPLVLRQYPDAIFALVGKAVGDAQIRYQEQLRRQCHTLGIADSVVFTGYVPEADLVALYREATALAHPAVSEGFGLTLLDALALDAPVIAARASGPEELLRHEETGLLVPIRDANALGEAILRLLQNPELAQNLRGGGRNLANSLSANQMAGQITRIYQRMAQRETA